MQETAYKETTFNFLEDTANKKPQNNSKTQSHPGKVAAKRPENGDDRLRLRKETAKGLRYCHTRINDNTSKTLQSTSFLYALVEILVEKGILTVEELDARHKKVAERLVEKFKNSGLGLMYQDPEMDKYEFDQEAGVDCENSVPVCKAVCCKLPFALSKQDVEEGIMKWDFGRPYIIAHDEDGYCTHLDRESYKCSVWEHRPVPCRGFDCRNSKNWPVWEDYDKKELNVKIIDKINCQNGNHYFFSKITSDTNHKA